MIAGRDFVATQVEPRPPGAATNSRLLARSITRKDPTTLPLNAVQTNRTHTLPNYYAVFQASLTPNNLSCLHKMAREEVNERFSS